MMAIPTEAKARTSFLESLLLGPILSLFGTSRGVVGRSPAVGPPANITNRTTKAAITNKSISLDLISSSPEGSGTILSVSCCGRRLLRRATGCAITLRSRKLLDHIEAHRNKEDADYACRQHPPDDCGAHYLPSHRPGSGRGPQRHAAQDERKRGHQNGAQAEPRPFQSSIH